MTGELSIGHEKFPQFARWFYNKFSVNLLDLQLKHTVLGFLISKKFLEEKIFAGTNFHELAFDRKNCENFCLAKISRYTVVYVAVLGRSQTLFHCVFRTRYHVWSAVMQNFYEGQDSYALHRCTNMWLVHYCMQFMTKISLVIGVGNCAVTCMWPACS